MDDGDIDRHPDLIDADWVRAATKRAERAARRTRRRDGLRFRFRRASTGARGPKPRRERSRLIAAVVVVTAVAMLGVGYLPGVRQRLPRFTGATALSSLPPTVTATTRVHARVDLNQPFANTPAAGWGDGAAGIVPPQTMPVGPYSADQVADALAKVKQVLITGNLDPAVLIQHDATGYLAQFAPRDQDHERQYLQPGNDIGQNDVTMIASGHRLLPAAPKVNGTMSVDIDPKGLLRIHANYVFAYAFAEAGAEDIVDPMSIIALKHLKGDFLLVTGARIAAASLGLWHGGAESFTFSIDCAEAAKGFLAPRYHAHDATHGSAGGDTSANPDTYFDPAHGMEIGNDCRTGDGSSRDTLPPTTTSAPPPTLVTA